MGRSVIRVSRAKTLLDSYSKSLRKSVSTYSALRVARWQLHAARIWTRFQAAIGSVAISVFAVLAAVLVLSVPALRTTVDSFSPLEAILAQLGATFGTILALVLTLSII